MNTKKKILLIGNAQHGKDTAAEMISNLYGYKFKSSSDMANQIVIFDTLKEKYGYETLEQCYQDRVNHRAEWYDLICEYNKTDKAKLAKAIMEESDIYVGMRDHSEIEECIKQGVFDIIIGIYDPRKPLEDKSSFNIDLFQKADIIIPNGGTLGDLAEKLYKLQTTLTINNELQPC